MIPALAFSQAEKENKIFLPPSVPVKIVKIQQTGVANNSEGPYIFKNPRNIAVTENGSFFLIDDGKVLQFGSDGQFIKTIIRKGTGPKEAIYLSQLFLSKNQLVVNTGIMGKLMVFDLNGELKIELSRQTRSKLNLKNSGLGESSFRILGCTKDNELLLALNIFAPIENHKRKNFLNKPIFLLSTKNQWGNKLFDISIDAIKIKSPMGNRMLQTIKIKSTTSGSHIYYSSSDRYEIKCYNIIEHKNEGIWKREYTPIKIPIDRKQKYNFGLSMSGSKDGKPFVYKPPPRNYFPDIQRLFWMNNNLWVVTSTVDSEKGVLVDMFSEDGQYSGHFYLPMPGVQDLYSIYQSQFDIKRNHLIVKEIDEEENYKIVIYEIKL